MMTRAAPRLCPLVLMALLFSAAPAFATGEIIVTSSQRVFQLAANAAQQALEAQGHKARIVDVDALPSVGAPPRIWIAVGPAAARALAKRATDDVHVVVLLTPDRQGLPVARSTWVELQPNLDTVYKAVMTVLPKAKRHGVLATPADNAQLAALERKGVQLDRAKAGAGLAAEVDRLMHAHSDVIWVSATHPATRAPDAIALIVSSAANCGVPVVGVGRSALKHGVLFAAVPDPAAQGRAAAAAALGRKRGGDITAPAKILLSRGNAKTIGVRIPEALAGIELVD